MKLYKRSAKSKSGLTTVIGGAIVIAIVIGIFPPMFFYMTSFKNLYTDVVSEMTFFDMQRNMEDLTTDIWPRDVGNISINIKNNGPYAVDITRLWVIPSDGSDPNWTNVEISLVPDSKTTLYSESVNEYVSNLNNTMYYIKLTTTKGNVFYSPPRIPMEKSGEVYKYPLLVLRTSVIKEEKWEGYKWWFILHVYNQIHTELTVDYVIITAQYGTGPGHKSLVNIKDVDITFPPQKQWVAEKIGFDADKGANVFLVELIGERGYPLGMFYYIMDLE